MRYDLLVKNGRIYDGSGTESYGGTIAVNGGRLVAVGEVGGEAREVIDADGLAIAPGFVDVHTHYDAQIFWDPLLTSSCWHGVTTLVMGNCGLALAPCKPEHRLDRPATPVGPARTLVRLASSDRKWVADTVSRFPQETCCDRVTRRKRFARRSHRAYKSLS